MLAAAFVLAGGVLQPGGANQGPSPSNSSSSILEVLYSALGASPAGSLDVDPVGSGLARLRSLKTASAATRFDDSSGVSVTVTQIRTFLSRKRSPMTPYADQIVASGVRYGVDPRVVVAIAGVESSFGKAQRGFNAWGWNGGKARWSSWSESIDSYTELLSLKYPDYRNIRRIASRYNPNTPDAWGRKVLSFMSSIDRVPA